MTRKKVWIVGVVVGLLLHGALAYAADKEMFSKLVCKGKKHPVCHVVKVKKISEDIQYLDMSELEGKTSDLPEITKKGSL